VHGLVSGSVEIFLEVYCTGQKASCARKFRKCEGFLLTVGLGEAVEEGEFAQATCQGVLSKV
jgi:hypothetical protein